MLKGYQAYGMDWKSFKEYKKKWILVQYFYQRSLRTSGLLPIADEGLYKSQRMSSSYAATVQFRLIDIILQTEDGCERPKPHAHCGGEAACGYSYGKTKAGDDFGSLAKLYSYDPVRAPLGGLWTR